MLDLKMRERMGGVETMADLLEKIQVFRLTVGS